MTDALAAARFALDSRKALFKECSENDGEMQRALENARQWSENGDPAWVQEQLPKWKKVEEAQREMLRMKIFQLEAAISSDKIFELEAAISSVPPHAPDVQIRFVLRL